jgi:hypothetical protein
MILVYLGLVVVMFLWVVASDTLSKKITEAKEKATETLRRELEETEAKRFSEMIIEAKKKELQETAAEMLYEKTMITKIIVKKIKKTISAEQDKAEHLRHMIKKGQEADAECLAHALSFSYTYIVTEI